MNVSSFKNKLKEQFQLHHQLEMKQRYLAGKMNGPDEKGDAHQEEVTVETLGK